MDLMAIVPMIFLPGAVSAQKAFGSDIVQMVIHAGLMVKFVLLILLFFSVVSWAIILLKWRLLSRAKQETAYFIDLFWGNMEFGKIYSECDDLMFSPIAILFRSGYSELRRISRKQANPETQSLVEDVERTLKRAAIDQGNRLERALSFLATTGNTAPFIGLFGTVWGIMEAFRGIGLKGSASLAVVAPGISEALIATAAGLAAAIPAVVAFNFLSQRVMVLRSDMDSFISDFLGLIERHLSKRQKTKET